MAEGMRQVRQFRKQTDDAYYFNWLLKVARDLQEPFVPTHENMRNIDISRDQPPHMLAANLRRAFSGIVAGNVKYDGIKAIEKYGLFEITGDGAIMEPVDALLRSFVEQDRMKLPGARYQPCYKIVA